MRCSVVRLLMFICALLSRCVLVGPSLSVGFVAVSAREFRTEHTSFLLVSAPSLGCVPVCSACSSCTPLDKRVFWCELWAAFCFCFGGVFSLLQ